MIKNEKIKAADVHLIDVDGDDLGVMRTSDALAMAKRLKVDLVCTSLLSSPPLCRLISSGKAKQQVQQERKQQREPKLKEIRLTPQIEEHDYTTKLQQAEKILTSGDSVRLVFRVNGKESLRAKELLESMVQDLAAVGQKLSGIQVSGKQVMVQLSPLQMF